MTRSPAAAPPLPTAESPLGALLVLALGAGADLLVLLGLAVLAAAAGFPVPGAVAALDPGRSGSLPELWGVALLALAGAAPAVAWARGGSRGVLALAMPPLALLAAEGGDLAAHLAHLLAAASGLGPSAVAVKLFAGGAIGALVAGSALPAWRGFAVARPFLACGLALGAALAGAASLGLDMAGGRTPGGSSAWHGVELVPALEEVIELALYGLVAAATLAAVPTRT